MSDHQEPVPFEQRALERIQRRSGPLLSLETANSDRYFYLRTYANILFKHRCTILTAAFVLTTLAAIVSFKQEPVYEAIARVEVEADVPAIQSLNDLDRSVPSDEVFLETQVRILESDNLAWQTIQQLGLTHHPQFSSRAGAGKPPGIPTDASLQSEIIATFGASRQVRVVRNSRMLEISFQSPDPQLAPRVANALVSNYIEHSFRKKYNATRQASGWMEQQLDELKAKVENSQQALLDYERKNALVSINDKQNMGEQRLADLSKELTSAQADRLQKEALYELISANESQVALIAQNELLTRLEEKHADLKTQYVDALNQYGPNFPKVTRLGAQANEVQSLIDRERKRIVARIRNEYTAALGREKLLSAAVSLQKEEVGRLNQLLIQHNLLKREFETNQQLYENLLHRLKDATLSAGLRATNVHLVDPAYPPAVPVSPKRLRNIMLGLMLGLLAGVTIALVRESLDTSIQSPEDVEKLSGLPALALIPTVSSVRARPGILSLRTRSSASENGAVDLAVLRAPGSALAESYRALRTAVMLATPPRSPQALLVTSAQPGEGKSCTSLNLALALAQQGCRVLLVDSDLRRSGVGAKLGLADRDRKGLTSCLAGAHRLEEVVHTLDELPNLWVLPAGPRPSNPAELLASASMENVMRELRRQFDHLVLDSPPVLLVTDATILSTLVDGVLLVVESGVTSRNALVRARGILEAAGGNILGAILNRVDFRLDGYYGLKLHGYYRSYFT